MLERKQEKAMATHPSTLSWKIPHTQRSLVGCSHGVAKSWTWLSDFTFTFHFPALEKEMATHSIVLAWWIPGMGEPGGLPSMGSHRVGHDWSNLAAAAAPLSMKTLTSASQPFHSKVCQHPRYSIQHQSLSSLAPLSRPYTLFLQIPCPLKWSTLITVLGEKES